MTAATATAPRPAPPRAPGHADEAPFTGTVRLARHVLRRDRVRIPVWALSISGLIGYFSAVLPIAYPDPAALQARAAIMKDPSGAFMTGPGYGLDDYTFGRLLANEMVGMLAVATALMSIFLVVRHTRAEEETGRAELVRAGVVGRHAPLTAALLDVLVANVVVTAAFAAVMVASDLDAPDSLAVSVAIGVVGLVFGAVAAVTAQLAEHSRSASGMAGAALGLAYVLRGVGDARQLGGSALSWASPIGWAQQTRAFVDLRWWPLLLCVALAVALTALAYVLAGRRDVGAGLVPARAGRADARPGLLGVAGLSARMERGSVVGWAIGLVVFAVLTGSMGQGIVESFEDQPQLAEIFGGAGEGDILRGTLASFLGFFAMAVAVYVVIAVNRLRREEDEGRTAAVLATGVSRARWLGGSLLVTGAAATLLLAVSGLALGAGAGASVGDSSLAGQFALAALVYVPVVWCFMGLAVLALGARVAPGWVWLVLIASIIVGMYGPMMELPDAVLDAAPFGLVPLVPSEDPAALPLILMVGVAAALAGLAAAAFRRRDLTA
ncbi:ABC transporter permease [Actinotalea subterranea]|uniref:ABC transporter permease n=1 Tax=Actinotalea subterranea TaxID=2607497 RepID=UPI0011EBB2B7|nr:polyketide antibiotic transporter [Actinotalea subterranea]